MSPDTGRAERPAAASRRRRPRRFAVVAVALGAAASLHSLVYLPFVSPHTTMDSPTYLAAARAILSGSYSTPLPRVDSTGLRIPAGAVGAPERQTVRTPGYPLFLAALGGGQPGVSRDLVYAAQALLCGAATLLLTLTARLLWNERIGILAGVLYAVDPYSKRYVSLVLTETLATFLAVAAAYAFVRARRDGSLGWWTATGALLALLTLTRPVFALALPLAALVVLFTPRWRAAAAYAGVVGLLLVPWLVWTTEATGKPVLSSFGEGWNLLLAANGEGPRTTTDVERSPAYVREFTSVHRFAPGAAALRADPTAHPRYLARADGELRRIAERVYRHRFVREPLTVVGEVLYRAAFLWSAHRDWYQPAGGIGFVALELVSWLTIAIAVAGVLLAFRDRGPPRDLGVLLLVFTLVSALHHVEARYALPLRGLELAFVARALGALLLRPA